MHSSVLQFIPKGQLKLQPQPQTQEKSQLQLKLKQLSWKPQLQTHNKGEYTFANPDNPKSNDPSEALAEAVEEAQADYL